MIFTVIGMGKTGHTACAYLMSKGQCVTAWDRKAEKRAVIAACGITVDGALQGHYTPHVEENIGLAIQKSQCILVMTTADGHRDVANLLRGKLSQGQIILVFNCNWGAYEFWQILGDEAKEKNVVIGETGGMLLLSNMTETGKCYLRSVKRSMPVATIPAGACGDVIAALQDVFPQFLPAEHILQTSLNATNPILHAPLDLFCLARIEKGEEYYLYGDGATTVSVGYIEKIDRERLAVLEAMGIKGTSCLEMINDAWSSSYTDLLTGLLDVKAYKNSMGPRSIHYRHFTEDLPYGISPIQQLGKQNGVATPYIDALLNLYKLALNLDIDAMAPDLTDLDIAKVCG